jgi:transposase, IS5 family
MRRIQEAVLPFIWNNDDLPKTVREYREKYKGVSRILDDHPEILGLVHEDLKRLSSGSRKGRDADFTSETILRALVVHAIEGLSFRETVVRIAESDFLQDFLRTRKKAVMDFTFLDKCFQAIGRATWKRVNATLGRRAAESETIDVSTIRADTTAIETNIHWPTDASLLWDTWRVAARLLRQGRAIDPATCPHRFHDRKTKRLYLFITRYIKSKNQRRQRTVRATFRQLIERVEWIVEAARRFCDWAPLGNNLDLTAVADELRRFLPTMRRVVDQARRAQIQRETVPASERVFSIFEPHTELIKRGRSQKPVEFGHMVLLCQTPEKFITDYEAYRHRRADCQLTEEVIERHEELFGQRPEVLAADMGFCPDEEKYEELQGRVGTLAIPRRMRDLADAVLSMWRCFRAGIEGTISGLKRAFRLARCHYHGFKRFAAALGLGVLCHNLVVLAKQTMT